MSIETTRSVVAVGTVAVTAHPDGPQDPPILGGPWGDRAHSDADHPGFSRGKFTASYCPTALFMAPIVVSDGVQMFEVGGLDEARDLHAALGAVIAAAEVEAERSRLTRAEVAR